ncbi:type II toxin-antitoxin system VapC family toxin [Zavarzinia sp. CC-PAN008]|uniref:type II toxin-antitoxin system VapC family toxin n=1 Tax=Zavarzinia sp. CC-PAN008 TaxID=3243332 RepID=UPI003F74AC8E
MILVDTNVVSEPLRPAPDERVTAWLDAQVVETLHLSAVSLAELRFGIASLPAGRRRSRLLERLEQEMLPMFDGRILPFDAVAAQHYAALKALARASGQAIGSADGYIAATAAAHRLAVASRDRGPFVAAGLRVIDPWTGDGGH